MQAPTALPLLRVGLLAEGAEGRLEPGSASVCTHAHARTNGVNLPLVDPADDLCLPRILEHSVVLFLAPQRAHELRLHGVRSQSPALHTLTHANSSRAVVSVRANVCGTTDGR